MILVVVGEWPFPRLITKMDEIAPKLRHEVIMQTGNAGYIPQNAADYSAFYDAETYYGFLKKADIVVAHAGSGSTLDCILHEKRAVLVPRMKKYGELVNDHQFQHMKGWQERMEIKVVYDVDELESILTGDLNSIPVLKPSMRENNLVNELRKAIIELGGIRK